MLNDQGYRTKRDCKWTQNAVCGILTNELYTGRIINGKQEVSDFLTGQRVNRDEADWMIVERPELQIISREEFDLAQKILHERHDMFKSNKTRHSNAFLFSTLIKCKDCGWSFRRLVRTHRNTYIRWCCSGHNGNGAASCPNAVTVDENELIDVLQSYFEEIISHKKQVVRYIVGEFEKVYKARDENVYYERELNQRLAKLKKSREKYMDMYTDELITREELNERIGKARQEIERLEKELQVVRHNLTKGDQLERILNETFKEIESITDVRSMTNAQIKRIIKEIVVDHDGNVEIYLRLLSDLGLEKTVPICDDRTSCSYRILRRELRSSTSHPPAIA